MAFLDLRVFGLGGFGSGEVEVEGEVGGGCGAGAGGLSEGDVADVEGAMEVFGAGDEALDGEELEAGVAGAVGGGIEARLGGFLAHGFGGLGEGAKNRILKSPFAERRFTGRQLHPSSTSCMRDQAGCSGTTRMKARSSTCCSCECQL